VDTGVDARVRDSAAAASSGTAAIGISRATPEANANDDAACPLGNDAERACRPGGRAAPVGNPVGAPRVPLGLQHQVDGAGGHGDRRQPVDRGARRPRSPVAARRAAAAIHSFEPSAARDSAALNRSSPGVGVVEMAAPTSRAAREALT
jgi:hypothetical protein